MDLKDTRYFISDIINGITVERFPVPNDPAVGIGDRGLCKRRERLLEGFPDKTAAVGLKDLTGGLVPADEYQSSVIVQLIDKRTERGDIKD